MATVPKKIASPAEERRLSSKEAHDLGQIIKERAKVLEAHAEEQVAGFMIETGVVALREQPSGIVAEHRVRAIDDIATIDDLLDHIEDQQRRYQTAVLSPQQSQDVVRILSTLRDSLRISLG